MRRPLNRVVCKLFLPSLNALLSLGASMIAVAQQYRERDPGGLFNPPPVTYNLTYFGYGSTGKVTHNKIDLQDGRTMQMQETTLYDNAGQLLATATASGIGRVYGYRDGGLIAGSIYDLYNGGQTKQMTYAGSVNVQGGGRQSGWIDVNALSSRNDIVGILTRTKRDRLALFETAVNHDNYRIYTLQIARLPN